MNWGLFYSSEFFSFIITNKRRINNFFSKSFYFSKHLVENNTNDEQHKTRIDFPSYPLLTDYDHFLVVCVFTQYNFRTSIERTIKSIIEKTIAAVLWKLFSILLLDISMFY